MLYYFQLQLKLISRQISDFGINPIVGFLLLPILFVGASVFLFYKTEYAPYVYILAAIASFMKLGNPRRSDLLRTCFTKNGYTKLRMLENLAVALPFAIFLSAKALFGEAFLVLLISVFLSLLKIKQLGTFTLPTPFSRHPFEFVTGFRQSVFGLISAYVLTVISLSVGNVNLGIFSVLLVYLICFTYYLNPENEYFIWIFNCKPPVFLIRKAATAIVYSFVLTLPMVCILAVFFPERWATLVGVQLLGLLFLIATVLAKYSVYPGQINPDYALAIRGILRG